MARVFYRQNPKGQTEVLRSPGGPVAKHLLRLGNLTQRYAREQAGRRTGRLAASIKVQLTAKSTGLAVKVGSNNKIAYLHHEGSRPHIIRARNVAYLRFYSHGKLRFAKSVRHPGTRANPYLQRSMALAIGRIH